MFRIVHSKTLSPSIFSHNLASFNVYLFTTTSFSYKRSLNTSLPCELRLYSLLNQVIFLLRPAAAEFVPKTWPRLSIFVFSFLHLCCYFCGARGTKAHHADKCELMLGEAQEGLWRYILGDLWVGKEGYATSIPTDAVRQFTRLEIPLRRLAYQ